MKSNSIIEFFEQIENYVNNGTEYDKELYTKFLNIIKKYG